MSVKFANITLFELIAKKRDHQLPRLSNELVRLEGLDSGGSQFRLHAFSKSRDSVRLPDAVDFEFPPTFRDLIRTHKHAR